MTTPNASRTAPEGTDGRGSEGTGHGGAATASASATEGRSEVSRAVRGCPKCGTAATPLCDSLFCEADAIVIEKDRYYCYKHWKATGFGRQ